MTIVDDLIAAKFGCEAEWDPSRLESSLVMALHRATEASGNFARAAMWVRTACDSSVTDWERKPGRTFTEVAVLLDEAIDLARRADVEMCVTDNRPALVAELRRET
jgi:hypothetical protein